MPTSGGLSGMRTGWPTENVIIIYMHSKDLINNIGKFIK